MKDANNINNLKEMLASMQVSADNLKKQKEIVDKSLDNLLSSIDPSKSEQLKTFVDSTQTLLKGIKSGDITDKSDLLQDYIKNYGKGVSKE